MALLYPDNCKAHHINLNLTVPSYRNPYLAAKFYLHAMLGTSQQINEAIAGGQWFREEGSGYFSQQSTKPQTIGYSQADSPVGLLAWIYEKLHDWTDSYAWTDDEVLTCRAGPAASSRIYYETEHEKGFERGGTYNPKVKLGVSRFPKDIVAFPTEFGQVLGPLVFQSSHERGGHFAAYECPDLLVDDLRAMFGKQGGAFGVVEGKNDYV
ncbi:MAG: hypothetical protein Q9159_003551 [Coniocarpon cinnabarinum]